MQPTLNLFKALLFACLLLLAPLAQAAFTINNDGTVTDPKTGLTWMRCAMGQTWDGSTCTGTASTYTYDQAVALKATFAGQSDWRMPNIRELQTIVDRSVYLPVIDSSAFPNTPSSNFWSGSPSPSDSYYAWYVDFSYGFAYDGGNRSGIGAVRLVRGGQSFGPLLGITRPNSDYVDHGNGTVTHTPTGLTWKRCSEGQTWTGSTCSGTAMGYTFYQANSLTGITTFAGQSDWRMPTEDELVSLVDYSIAYPGLAINSSIFPATPSPASWSSSPYVSNSYPAWLVNFDSGSAHTVSKGNYYRVRLVRSGQSFEQPLALTVGISGTGYGNVASSPSGISCYVPQPGVNYLVAPDCTESYANGASITLTATPASGSTFTGWGGACAGTGTCTVNMTAAQNVTATFTQSVATNVPSTVPGTMGNDFFLPSGNNSYYGGAGDDTYIISPYTLNGAVTTKIIDTEGTNAIQLVGGMTILSSSFFMDAAQLMLSNGAIVQILGASKFAYQLGVNILAGETASNLSYAQFATALGASIPAAGSAAVSGTANFVVPGNSSATPMFTTAPSPITLSVGTSQSFIVGGGKAPYAAVSSNAQVTVASMSGTTLTISGVASGTANIRVSDINGTSITITVTVVN